VTVTGQVSRPPLGRFSWPLTPTLGSLKRRATGDINCGRAVESLRLFAAALLVLASGQSGADPGIMFCVSLFWLIRFTSMTQPTDRPRHGTDTGPSSPTGIPVNDPRGPPTSGPTAWRWTLTNQQGTVGHSLFAGTSFDVAPLYLR
jgi:hypothetical protein